MKAEEFKISRRVRMANCYEAIIHGNKIWETMGEPWECCGAVVVRLRGRRGGFDIKNLAAADEAAVKQ